MMECNEQALRRLLGELAADHDDSGVALHVEQCFSCQQQLAALAADQDTWRDASAALRDTAAVPTPMVVTIDPELHADVPFQIDNLPLDFLEPPSHPELLGRLAGYEIERVIGAGGMGIVLKAFDSELHRPVAVKVLAPHLAHSGAARQRFAREAQAAAAVVHENVVPIYHVDSSGKLPFLAMQYLAGGSLQARIDTHGPLDVAQILRIAIQISSGLAAAHRLGMIHRDVKPANMLLEDGVDRIMISDFGLARTADDASVTRSGFIAGTPHYMSPEQAQGGPIDARSDLFGLGSVLYFMATGHPPFRAEGAMAVLQRVCFGAHRPIDEIRPDLPDELIGLIDQLLAKNARERPASAEAVAEELVAISKNPQPRSRWSRRQRKRNRRAIIIAVCSFAAIGVSLAAYHYGLRDEKNMMVAPRDSQVAAERRAVAPKPNTAAESLRKQVEPAIRPQTSTAAGQSNTASSDRPLVDQQFRNELLQLEADVTTYQLTYP